VYEYTPIPPLAWPELSGEIWCHRYYLRNLCNEERFKGWEVVEHIPLLQVGGAGGGPAGRRVGRVRSRTGCGEVRGWAA
jgi:hypothetical protein